MTVYLVGEPFVETAAEYASQDRGAKLVLLEDAVYSHSKVHNSAELYVVDEDIARRALKPSLPPSVHVVTYGGLVEMMEKEKVVNFL